MFLDIRSNKIREYDLFKTNVVAIQPPTKTRAIRERYRGWNIPAKAMIIPDPTKVPTLTTVPRKKGLIRARYSAGKSPIRTPLAGLLMVFLKILVNDCAYMAEKISNLNRKARKAIT